MESRLRWIEGAPSRFVWIMTLASSLTGIGIIGLLLPAYRLGELAAYYVRLRPLFIWAGTLGIQFLVLGWFLQRVRFTAVARTHLAELRLVLGPAGWIMLGLVFTWGVMLAAIRGVTGYEDYLYEAGVPILALQVALSLLAGILFRKLIEPRLDQKRPGFDRLAFIAIWVLAALFWASRPAPYSYMNPEPRPPNHEVYPYSDASQYDLQAQYALLGQGLDNGASMDNPMYPALLAAIHFLTGQDYETNMSLQAGLLAVLPAIAYLLGRSLHSRALGLVIALLTAFQGANTISAAGLINVASPKQMLTDFPTAIGVALALLTAVHLLRQREEDRAAALWHGASLGFVFLIRPTGVALLPVVPFLALLRRMPLQRWLRMSVLVLGSFALFLTPWGIRNELLNHDAVGVYLSKFDLVNRTRYRDLKPQSTLRNPSPALDKRVSSSRTMLEQPSAAEAVPLTLVITRHFANNLWTSVLTIPTSLVFDDLQHRLVSPSSPWKAPFDGSLTPGQWVMLLAAAAIVSLGGAAMWRRVGIAAAAPLLAFILYNLVNSAARTSGGRYIVPVDWIPLLYFGSGLLTVLDVGEQSQASRGVPEIGWKPLGIQNLVGSLILIAVLGATPILVEGGLPAHRAQTRGPSVEIAAMTRSALLDVGYTAVEVDAYMASRAAVSLAGRAMYPKWFSYRAVAREADAAWPGLLFPHLEFTVIGKERGAWGVFLFTPSAIELPNAADVLVVGCRPQGPAYIEALAVVERDAGPGEGIHFRASLPELKCPEALPACDNNANCR